MILSLSKASFFRAVTEGNRELVASSLGSGADANARNDGGQTPLILAIISGRDQLLRMLLDFGADPFLTDQTGLNAVDWAERKGRVDIAELLQRGLPPDPSGITKTSQDTETPTRANVASEQQPTRATRDEEKARRYLQGLLQRFAENPKPRVSRLTATQPEIERSHSNDTQPAKTEPPRRETDEATNLRSEPPVKRRGDRAQNAKERYSTTTSETEAIATEQRSEATTQAPNQIPIPSSRRKRCPECNTIYNSELLTYCSYHEVPLVDADTPLPIASESNRPSLILWTLVIVTLFAAAIVTGYVSERLFRNESAGTQPAGPQLSSSLKGTPAARGELAQKVTSLPDAKVPSGTTQRPTTVEVSVRINRLGQVTDASSTNDNQMLRDSAVAAAKKATFSVEKLKGRGTTGIITYTFNP